MGNAIELRGISKSFGSVAANKNINLTVEKGEILALLGENGSGKTTLMNMLSGIYMPDSGSIFVDGKKVSINSPEQSAKLGIGMVHQHFKLVERFTALENIRLGLKTGGKFLLAQQGFEWQALCKGATLRESRHRRCSVALPLPQTSLPVSWLEHGLSHLPRLFEQKQDPCGTQIPEF